MLSASMGVAVWILASAAVSSALVRLILGVLAAHATRKALSTRDATHSSGACDACGPLAVLRALLNGLKPPRR
ncbi:hypothetical protein [Streptomyces sp. NPDC002851]